MLAAPGAIAFLLPSLKNKPAIEALISSALSLKKHKFCFLITPSVLRSLRDFAGTTIKVGAIRKPIVVLIAPNLKAKPRLPRFNTAETAS